MTQLAAFLLPLPSPLLFPADMTFYQADESEIAAAVANGADIWEMPEGFGVSVTFELVDVKEGPFGIDARELHRLNKRLIPKMGRRPPKPKPIDGAQLVAIAVSRINEDDESLSPVFDRCLVWVRHMCAVWRHAAQADVLLPEYDSLPPFISCAVHDSETNTHTPGLFGLKMRAQGGVYGPEDEEAFASNFVNMIYALNSSHPGVLYQDRVREARACLFEHGQRDNSVVLAMTAAEALIDNTLTALAWERGLSPAEAARKYYRNQGLTRRVRDHMPSLLGGNWDLAGDGAVALWYSQLAQLRHQVVHEGYVPSRHEAIDSLEALWTFEAHVVGRVAANVETYPKTAVLIAARRGLERHDAFSEEFVSWLEKEPQEELLESYVRWRGEMYQEWRAV